MAILRLQEILQRILHPQEVFHSHRAIIILVALVEVQAIRAVRISRIAQILEAEAEVLLVVREHQLQEDNKVILFCDNNH